MANQSDVPSMMPWWSWPLSVLSVMIPHWIIMRLEVNLFLHVNWQYQFGSFDNAAQNVFCDIFW